MPVPDAKVNADSRTHRDVGALYHEWSANGKTAAIQSEKPYSRRSWQSPSDVQDPARIQVDDFPPSRAARLTRRYQLLAFTSADLRLLPPTASNGKSSSVTCVPDELHQSESRTAYATFFRRSPRSIPPISTK